MKPKIKMIGGGIAVLLAGLLIWKALDSKPVEPEKTKETTSTVSTVSTSSQNSRQTAQEKKVDVLPNDRIVKEELSIQRDSYSIYGQLTAPEGYESHRLPLIIFSHGFGNTLEFVDVYAEALAKKGYLVYSFDFVGGSQSSRSGGSMLEMSVFTEQSDLDAVLAQLKTASYVDATNIFLAGFSQGGVVSTMTAAQHANEVRGLMTLNAAFVLFDDARSLFRTVEDIPAVYNHRGTNLGKVYFEQLLDYDIYQTMSQFSKPVLVVQGTADDIVPLSYAERAQQAFPQAQLVEIEGGDHIFDADQSQQTIDAMATYLQQVLETPQP